MLARMLRSRSARALIKAVVRHHLDWAEANRAWARAHLINPDRARGPNSARDQGAKLQP